jgi:hypothetical protein
MPAHYGKGAEGPKKSMPAKSAKKSSATKRGAEGPKRSVTGPIPRAAARKANSGRNGGTGVNRQGPASASGVYRQKRGR